jgi:hypothetical protein
MVLLAAVALATPTGKAASSLSVTVTPSVSVAPGHVVVTVVVEPSAENRALVIEADGENDFRSSERELEGEAAPRTHTIRYRDLAGGSYRLTARLLRANQGPEVAQQQFLVVQ